MCFNHQQILNIHYYLLLAENLHNILHANLNMEITDHYFLGLDNSKLKNIIFFMLGKLQTEMFYISKFNTLIMYHKIV